MKIITLFYKLQLFKKKKSMIFFFVHEYVNGHWEQELSWPKILGRKLQIGNKKVI